MTEQRNQNFAALDLDEDLDSLCPSLERDAEFLAPPPLMRAAPSFYSDTSDALLGAGPHGSDTYRCVMLDQPHSDALPGTLDNPFDFGGLSLDASFAEQSHAVASDFTGAGHGESRPCGIKRMHWPVAQSFPSPVHAFSRAEGAVLLDRIEQALADAEVLSRPFEKTSSSFACRRSGFRFDVYVQELAEADRAEFGHYIVEVQRLNANGACDAWAALMDQLMAQLGDILLPGRPVFAFPTDEYPVGPSLVERAEKDLAAQLPEVDQEVLDKEYQHMLALMADISTPLDTKRELAHLMAQVASEPEGCLAMVRIGGLPEILKVLQASGHCSELTTSLCSIVADIVNQAEQTAKDALDLGVLVTLGVLRSASKDVLELDTLRKAAKALAVFAKHLGAQASIRPEIQSAVIERCHYTADAEFAEHSNAILRNLSIGA